MEVEGKTEGERAVFRGAFSFFSGTCLSRVSGMLRDVSMACFFGSHPAIAAFMVAYRFANLFRRLLGEGPLPSGVIPHFESRRKTAPKEAALFFRDLLFSLAILLVALVLLFSLGLFLWIQWGDLNASLQEILSLTLLMMPGLIFICLYAISSALLQCERKFFLPSVAPVLFNVAWIATVFVWKDALPSSAVIALSWAVVAGFFLQWVLLLPSMRRYFTGFLSRQEFWQIRFFPQDVKAVIQPFLLGLIGVSAVQVNTALDAVFARISSLEGPAYLWYAVRIEQLPLALFGIALSSALLPPLSRAFSKGDRTEFQTLLQSSFSKSFCFMFPCMIALFVLAASGVNLLYGRGDFGFETTRQTILCLWGYGIGLLPSVFVLLLAPAFYAQRNFKGPMKAAVLSVALNIFLNALFVLVFHWGAFSIALSTSLSAWMNYLLLLKTLEVRTHFDRSMHQVAFCSLIAGGVTFLLAHFLAGDPTLSLLFGKVGTALEFSREFRVQLLQFSVLVGIFGLSFLSYAWHFGIQEVLALLKLSKRQNL